MPIWQARSGQSGGTEPVSVGSALPTTRPLGNRVGIKNFCLEISSPPHAAVRGWVPGSYTVRVFPVTGEVSGVAIWSGGERRGEEDQGTGLLASANRIGARSDLRTATNAALASSSANPTRNERSMYRVLQISAGFVFARWTQCSSGCKELGHVCSLRGHGRRRRARNPPAWFSR